MLTKTREIPFGRPMIGEEERAAVLEVLDSPQLVHGPRAHAFEEAFAAMLGPGAHATTGVLLHGRPAPGLPPSRHRPGRRGDRAGADARRHRARGRDHRRAAGVRRLRPGDRQHRRRRRSRRRSRRAPRRSASCTIPACRCDMDRVNAARPAARGCSWSRTARSRSAPASTACTCGLLGDVGVFSFYPVKHMTTGEGGMVVSRHADVRGVDRQHQGVRRRPHAGRAHGARASTTSPRLGLNYRMSEIAAAIGLRAARASVPAMQRRRARQRRRAARRARPTLAASTCSADGDARRMHATTAWSRVLDDGAGGEAAARSSSG